MQYTGKHEASCGKVVFVWYSGKFEDSCDSGKLEDSFDSGKLEEDSCDSDKLEDSFDSGKHEDPCDSGTIEYC